MDRVLTNFIRALRSADVRVSPAESIDAARAVALIGYSNRRTLKQALATVLAKSPDEKTTHNELFDLYFARKQAEPTGASEETDAGNDKETASGARDLAESGDSTALQMALESAADAAGVSDIRFSTQVSYFTQKMVKALGGDALQADLLQALQAGTREGEAEADALIEARRVLTREARARVEQAFEVYGQGETQQFRDDYAANKALSQMDLRDMERMRKLVQKIAKRLAVKHGRRRRRNKRGQVDIRRTLRANAGLGGVPFDISWKQKKRERPKIIAICDVSGSVARYVRFLLLLLYSLQDVIPKLDAFAFSARLGRVSGTLENTDFDAAFSRIMSVYGMGSTSYGQALSDFKVDHWALIDRNTTVIILGDGRSNYGDPRLDIYREMNARAKRVIWLSPEPESLWGTGDSEMLRYQPFTALMRHVATLKDLERAVDDILAAYG